MLTFKQFMEADDLDSMMKSYSNGLKSTFDKFKQKALDSFLAAVKKQIEKLGGETIDIDRPAQPKDPLDITKLELTFHIPHPNDEGFSSIRCWPAEDGSFALVQISPYFRGARNPNPRVKTTSRRLEFVQTVKAIFDDVKRSLHESNDDLDHMMSPKDDLKMMHTVAIEAAEHQYLQDVVAAFRKEGAKDIKLVTKGRAGLGSPDPFEFDGVQIYFSGWGKRFLVYFGKNGYINWLGSNQEDDSDNENWFDSIHARDMSKVSKILDAAHAWAEKNGGDMSDE